MYVRNRTGPNTDPCGISQVSVRFVQFTMLLRVIHCFILVRQFLKSSKAKYHITASYYFHKMGSTTIIDCILKSELSVHITGVYFQRFTVKIKLFIDHFNVQLYVTKHWINFFSYMNRIKNQYTAHGYYKTINWREV